MGTVLGINGRALAGKDTVADYLISEYGWTAKLSFAKNLKEMCKAIFFLTDHDVQNQEGKKKDFLTPKVFTDRNLGSVMFWMSRTHGHCPVPVGAKEKVRSYIGTKFANPRHILQFIGTEICRELVPSYHVDVLVKQVRDNPDGRVIVTDVRFPNEGDLILDELGGLVVYLDRPQPPSDSANIDMKHPSETAMLEWGRFDDTIKNYREGLDFLYEEVRNFLRKQELCQTTQL